MKVPSCGVTFVPLHVGHLIRAFSLSETVTVSSNGFLHFSHMNSYLGMVTLPDQSSFRAVSPDWNALGPLRRVRNASLVLPRREYTPGRSGVRSRHDLGITQRALAQQGLAQ